MAIVAKVPLANPRYSVARDWLQLFKPRLNTEVILSALAGLYLGRGAAGLGWPLVVNFGVAVSLLAASAAALNMWLERDTDALMERTRTRPVAAGRLSPHAAMFAGGALALLSFSWLALGVGLLTFGLGLLTWASYLLVYTPLKRQSPVAVLVGAIPGALPPVMGWVAAGQSLDKVAAALFLIMFLWQVPHFLAIAWMYQSDYKKAGIKTLAVEKGDAAAARQILLYTVALLPVSLWPSVIGLTGQLYFWIAGGLGLLFLGVAIWTVQQPKRSRARVLLLASVTYLPLLFAAMLLDRVPRV